MKSMGVTRRLWRALLGWGCPRTLNYGSRWRKDLPRIWDNLWGILKSINVSRMIGCWIRARPHCWIVLGRAFFPRDQGRILGCRNWKCKWGAGVNVAFKEPVHKIVDQIKNEQFFKWPNKMGGDLSRRNKNLYCTYHRDKGHTTEQCQILKDHLGQLVKAGYLKEFVMDFGNQDANHGAQ